VRRHFASRAGNALLIRQATPNSQPLSATAALGYRHQPRFSASSQPEAKYFFCISQRFSRQPV